RELADIAGTLCRRFRQLYIVEHALLRFARAEGDHEEPGQDSLVPRAPFAYDFTITAVVAASAERAADPAWRAWVHEALRGNAPAHVVVDYCFLRPRTMRRFEALHGE